MNHSVRSSSAVHLIDSNGGEPVRCRGATSVSASRRGLFLDDDVPLLRATVRRQRSLGHTVLPCSILDEAVGVCRPYGRDLDLLLIDVDLGDGGDGAATAVAIGQLCPDLRVVFMSGHGRQALVDRGRLAPDAVLLEKPFSLHALGRALGYQP